MSISISTSMGMLLLLCLTGVCNVLGITMHFFARHNPYASPMKARGCDWVYSAAMTVVTLLPREFWLNFGHWRCFPSMGGNALLTASLCSRPIVPTFPPVLWTLGPGKPRDNGGPKVAMPTVGFTACVRAEPASRGPHPVLHGIQALWELEGKLARVLEARSRGAQ